VRARWRCRHRHAEPPAARNALTAETKIALLDTLRRCASDAAVRAVIVTGAGPAFCAGQDLREHAGLLEAGDAPLNTVSEHYNPIIAAITGMPKPVIAAVNGVAAGAGAALAFACDFRVAAQRASFLMAFARVGLARTPALPGHCSGWPAAPSRPSCSCWRSRSAPIMR